MLFSAPLKLSFLRVCYVCIEESYDTTFNMSFRGRGGCISNTLVLRGLIFLYAQEEGK